jgi:hypothetical protein
LKRVMPALLLMVLDLAIAACHNGSTRGAPPSPTPIRGTDHASPDTTSSSTLVASEPCSFEHLRGVLFTAGVTAGADLATITFRNLSSRACFLEGFPDVRLTDAAGRDVIVSVTHRHQAARKAVLASGGTADWNMLWGTLSRKGVPCNGIKVAKITATLPVAGTLVIDGHPPSENALGPIAPCPGNGEIQESPIGADPFIDGHL